MVEAERDHADDPHLHDHIHMTNPNTSWEAALAHAGRIGHGTRAYELIRVDGDWPFGACAKQGADAALSQVEAHLSQN